MNTDQRKALEKIISQTILNKYNDLGEERETEKELLKVKIEKENRNKANKIYQEVRKLDKEKEETVKEINALGFNVPYHTGEELEISLPNKEDNRIYDKYAKKERNLGTTKTKLIAKVWGVETDFDSLMKEVEKELSKI